MARKPKLYEGRERKMTYHLALKEWNSHRKTIDPSHVWAMPRKGTPEHTQVLEIQHGIFAEKAGAITKARRAGKKLAEEKAKVVVEAPRVEEVKPKRGRGRPRGALNKKYEARDVAHEELHTLKLPEIHAMMRAKKIRGTSGKNKAELIEMIKHHKPEEPKKPRRRVRSVSSTRVHSAEPVVHRAEEAAEVEVHELADGASGAAVAAQPFHEALPGGDNANNDAHMADVMHPRLHHRESPHRNHHDVPMNEKEHRGVGHLAHQAFKQSLPALMEHQGRK
jgi:hypothetical protein